MAVRGNRWLIAAGFAGVAALALGLLRREARPPDVAAVVAKLVAIKDGRSDAWPERGESSALPRSLVIGLPTAAAVNSVVIVRNAEPAGYDGGCIEAVTTGARRATASCLDFVAHRLRFVLVVDVRELVRGESGTMGSFDSSPSRPVFDVTVVDLVAQTRTTHRAFQASERRADPPTPEERARYLRSSLDEQLPKTLGARLEATAPREAR